MIKCSWHSQNSRSKHWLQNMNKRFNISEIHFNSVQFISFIMLSSALTLSHVLRCGAYGDRILHCHLFQFVQLFYFASSVNSLHLVSQGMNISSKKYLWNNLINSVQRSKKNPLGFTLFSSMKFGCLIFLDFLQNTMCIKSYVYREKSGDFDYFKSRQMISFTFE